MEPNEEETEYSELIRTLKGLRKVNAPADFELNLMRKLNEPEPVAERGIWSVFRRNSRLIPSAALAVAAVIIIFVFRVDSGSSVNPLLVLPKERTDIMVDSGEPADGQFGVNNPQLEKKLSEMAKKFAENDSNQDKSGAKNPGGETPYLTGSMIKSGLNFRQVNLDKRERMEVTKLKRKMETMINAGNKR